MPKRAFGLLVVLAGMLCLGLVLVTDWPPRRNILSLPEQFDPRATGKSSSMQQQGPNAPGDLSENARSTPQPPPQRKGNSR